MAGPEVFPKFPPEKIEAILLILLKIPPKDPNPDDPLEPEHPTGGGPYSFRCKLEIIH